MKRRDGPSKAQGNFMKDALIRNNVGIIENRIGCINVDRRYRDLNFLRMKD
jgi:hypothetical protein